MNKSKISNKAVSSDQGLLVIISAPSGCGKTTLVDRLLKRHPDWVRSISCTTRPIRPGEKPGIDYHFMTAEEFEKQDQEGNFLESARVFEQDYGTPRSFVRDRLGEGKKVLLAIDVQGMQKISAVAGHDLPVFSVFALPPSLKVLRERLEGRRTDSAEEIEKRIALAQDEIKAARFYDVTVVNQNLDQTVSEIEDAIENYLKNKRRGS